MFPGLIILDRDGLAPEELAELKRWAQQHHVLVVAKKPGALMELHPPKPCPDCPFQPSQAKRNGPGYVA